MKMRDLVASAVWASVVWPVALAQQPANPTDMQHVWDSARVKQSELDGGWKHYDFTELLTITNTSPDASNPASLVVKYRMHHAGNYEIARLTEKNGKPLDPKLQEKVENYLKTKEKRLDQQPAGSTEDSDEVSSAIASHLLRIMRPTAMAVQETGDKGVAVLQVETDPDLWARYIPVTGSRHLRGEVRIDLETSTLLSFTLTALNGDSSNGGALKTRPGAKYLYMQSAHGDRMFPDKFEFTYEMKRAFSKPNTARWICDFSDFDVAKERQP